jgi:hypothetical protein
MIWYQLLLLYFDSFTGQTPTESFLVVKLIISRASISPQARHFSVDCRLRPTLAPFNIPTRWLLIIQLHLSTISPSRYSPSSLSQSIGPVLDWFLWTILTPRNGPRGRSTLARPPCSPSLRSQHRGWKDHLDHGSVQLGFQKLEE